MYNAYTQYSKTIIKGNNIVSVTKMSDYPPPLALFLYSEAVKNWGMATLAMHSASTWIAMTSCEPKSST